MKGDFASDLHLSMASNFTAQCRIGFASGRTHCAFEPLKWWVGIFFTKCGIEGLPFLILQDCHGEDSQGNSEARGGFESPVGLVILARSSEWEKGSATMHWWQSVQVKDLPFILNPGQMSPEVQNRVISGPTKRTKVLQKMFNVAMVILTFNVQEVRSSINL